MNLPDITSMTLKNVQLTDGVVVHVIVVCFDLIRSRPENGGLVHKLGYQEDK